MAQWQIFKGKTANGAPIQVGEQFDDGLLAQPGDADFTTDLVAAEMKARKGDSWAYIGRSTALSEAMGPAIAAKTSEMAEAALEEIRVAAKSHEIEDVDAVVAEARPEVEAKARAHVLRDLGLREA